MSAESPPPFVESNVKQWAEDLIDFLKRQQEATDNTLDDHETRITALEP